jgi:hypothetical protein
MNEKKICFKQIACGSEPQPLENFYKHPKMADGHLGKCIACTKKEVEERRKYLEQHDPVWREKERLRQIGKANRQKARLRGTEVFRVWQKKAGEKWMRDNPNGKRAHGIVKRAIASGRLTRPNRCQRCGNKHPIIEAHHDDYSKPLDVEWLCKRCHTVVTFDEKRLAKEFTSF